MSEHRNSNLSLSGERLHVSEIYFSEEDSSEDDALDAHELQRNVEVFNGKAYISVDYLEHVSEPDIRRVFAVVERTLRVYCDEEIVLGLFSLRELKQLCCVVSALGICTTRAIDVCRFLDGDVHVDSVEKFLAHYRRLVLHEYDLRLHSEIENWMVPAQYCFDPIRAIAEAWRSLEFTGFSYDEISRLKSQIE